MAAAFACTAAGGSVAAEPAPEDFSDDMIMVGPSDDMIVEVPSGDGIGEVPPDDAIGEVPSGDMIGELRRIVAVHEDTLLDLARANGLGYVEMIAANRGVDPWVPGASTEIVLPNAHILPDAERQGLVVNLAEHRLYYFGASGAEPVTFPLGVGREGWSTPLGTTEIVRKKERPTWYPPESIRAEKPSLPKVVPPGPNNPLGSHALYFGWPTYLIHGTNQPWGIGRRVSHGCIRLYPEDIVRLFEIVPVGTPVQVVDQAVKIGWFEGELYIEAHPDARQADELEMTGRIESVGAKSLADSLYRITARAGDDRDRLDWRIIRNALEERSGIPVQITANRPATPS